MRKQTKLLIIVLILVTLTLIPASQVKAGLQSTSSTHYAETGKDTPINWIKKIRQMEEAGNAMGLSEKINTTNLTSTTSSNGIDVHMMKSTEYGAIAILSASGYGNSKTLQNSAVKTTTGNATGVYFSGANYEWVAGGLKGSIFSGVDARYYDAYATNNNSKSDYDISKNNAKIGDALGDSTTTNPGCAKWHGASNAYWVTGSNPYFGRGNGGLFSFSNNSASSTYWCRGVAVVGAGL